MKRVVAFLGSCALIAVVLLGCSSELAPPLARIELFSNGSSSASGGADGGVPNVASSIVVAVGSRVTLDGSTSSDPNGEPLAYRWRIVSAPAGSGAAIDAPSATVTALSPDVAGDYVVELAVSDGALTSFPVTATITAGPCGAHTPKIRGVTADSQRPVAGDAVLLSATVSDADTDQACGLEEHLSYQWSLTELPKGSRSTLSDPTLATPTLFTDEPGSYVVALVVTDALGHRSSEETVTVEASGCGDPAPEVTSVSFSPKSPDTFETVTLSAAVRGRSSDGAADGGAGDAAPSPTGCVPHFAYHWTLVGVPKGSAMSLADSPLESPSFVPDAPGDYVAELYLTNDEGRRSNVRSVTLHVSTCGSRAPVVSDVKASPTTPSIGQSVLLTAAVSDADTRSPCSLTEDFAYTWALSKLPSGSTAHLNDAHLASPSLTVDVAGAYEATVAVVDSRGLAGAPQTVSFLASACGGNAPSIVDVTATPSAPNTGATVVLDATATDPDTAPPCNLKDGIHFSWALRSVPPGSLAVLSDSSQESPWFAADKPGTYVAEVRALDDLGRTSDPKSVSVQVSTCGSAVPSIGAVSASPAAPNTGDVVSLTATVSDADTNPTCGVKESFLLTWSLVSVPAGSGSVLSGVHEASPWFSADVPGAYAVEARVTDSSGHTSQATRATVQVSACGSAAPSVSALAFAPALPSSGTNVTVSATVTDGDVTGCGKKETFGYLWALTRVPAGSAAVLTGTSTPLGGFFADVAGTYAVSLTATDSEGHQSAVVTGTVTVASASACGTRAPVARLAGITAAACAPLSTCSVATITPSPPGAPNATPPNYVVRLNGHPSVKLDASATFDPDAAAPCGQKAPLSYSWSILAAPVGSSAAWAIGSGATTQMVAPTFEPDLPGVYQVGLVVSDGVHASPTLVVQIDS